MISIFGPIFFTGILNGVSLDLNSIYLSSNNVKPLLGTYSETPTCIHFSKATTAQFLEKFHRFSCHLEFTELYKWSHLWTWNFKFTTQTVCCICRKGKL